MIENIKTAGLIEPNQELVNITIDVLSGAMLFGMEQTSVNIEASDPIKTSVYERKSFEEVDHIETVRQRLIQVFEKGEGYAKSWDDIKKITEQAGVIWKPGYWETVYRTNIQGCYTAGRLM